MAKFHLTEAGLRPCRATKGNCPFVEANVTLETPFERAAKESSVDSLIAAGDHRGLMDLIAKRTSSPGYRAALAERNGLYAQMKDAATAIEVARGDLPDENGKFVRSYVGIRETTLAYRALSEQLVVVNKAITDFRALNARAALASSELRDAEEKANGTFISYDENTIGDLVAIGEYEIGSPEWHAVRSAGIGGSDVGPIMRVDPVFGARDYKNLLAKKLGVYTEDYDDSMREDLYTAVGRGNAWEEKIRQMYADAHPDQRVAFCKTSWEGVGEHSFRHANFDALILDENGNGEGIVEIKTGVDSPKWGNVEDGVFGAPENYRKQVLWYAMGAKLKHGAIVAVLDDHDYREYTFDMSDPRVVAECQQIIKETDEFNALVETKKAELADGVDTVSWKPRKGFGISVDYDRFAKTLSAYTGEDKATVKDRVKAAFTAARNGSDESLSPEQIQSVMTSLYAAHDPATRTKPLIGIDLETTSASVKTGRIIETGIVSLDAQGNTETLYASLHGLPKAATAGLGIGDESIHRINASMVAGLPTFEDKNTQAAILSHLKKGVLVAHNAPFEDAWLTVNLAGYAEARDAGEIKILDTMKMNTYLMPDTADNSLRTFTQANGIPYVNAHAASVDTLMMMKGLSTFQRTLFREGKFVPAEITDAARAEAELLGQMDR